MHEKLAPIKLSSMSVRVPHETSSRYTLVPLNDLSVGIVVAGTTLGQVVGVHETTHRVTTL